MQNRNRRNTFFENTFAANQNWDRARNMKITRERFNHNLHVCDVQNMFFLLLSAFRKRLRLDEATSRITAYDFACFRLLTDISKI